jgi:hypothetical protein
MRPRTRQEDRRLTASEGEEMTLPSRTRRGREAPLTDGRRRFLTEGRRPRLLRHASTGVEGIGPRFHGPNYRYQRRIREGRNLQRGSRKQDPSAFLGSALGKVHPKKEVDIAQELSMSSCTLPLTDHIGFRNYDHACGTAYVFSIARFTLGIVCHFLGFRDLPELRSSIER